MQFMLFYFIFIRHNVFRISIVGVGIEIIEIKLEMT